MIIQYKVVDKIGESNNEVGHRNNSNINTTLTIL